MHIIHPLRLSSADPVEGGGPFPTAANPMASLAVTASPTAPPRHARVLRLTRSYSGRRRMVEVRATEPGPARRPPRGTYDRSSRPNAAAPGSPRSRRRSFFELWCLTSLLPQPPPHSGLPHDAAGAVTGASDAGRR